MRSLLAALVFSSFACELAPSLALDGPAAVTHPLLTTRQRLERDVASLRVQPGRSLGSFTTQRLVGGPSTVPIQLADGSLEAQALTSGAGSSILVSSFDATLGDVKFTKQQVPPSGLTLTSVHFTTSAPQSLEVQWLGDGNVGLASGTLSIDLHSALRLSTGGESPLAVAKVEVPVELTGGQTANGLIGLWLDIAPQGPMWNWGGLIELGDLAMSLEAYTPGSADQLPPGVELN